MKDKFHSLLAELQDQFAGQPRLRLGVWAILAILALYTVITLNDMRNERLPEVQRLADRHARLEAVIASGDWQDRRQSAEAALESRESRIWPSDSRGVARADFESWLRGEAEAAGLESVNLDIRELVAVDDLPGLYRLSARLEAQHDPAAMNKLLERLAQHDYRIGVATLSSRSGRRVGTQLGVVTVFHIDAGESS